MAYLQGEFSKSRPGGMVFDGFKPSRPLDKDKLYLIERETALRKASEMLDRVQNDSPEEVVAGAALVFALVCARLRLDPHDMHTFAKRVMEDQRFHLKANSAMQSLKDYAGLRLGGEHVSPM